MTFNNIHIGNKEIDHRIAGAWAAFAENKSLLKNRILTCSANASKLFECPCPLQTYVRLSCLATYAV